MPVLAGSQKLEQEIGVIGALDSQITVTTTEPPLVSLLP